MTDRPDISKPRFSFEWLLGGSLSRIGDNIDRFTRRSEKPKSSLATSQLIERLKRLLDAKAREIPGKGKVIPHNISLRMQWDKFSTDDNDTVDRLQQELLTAVVDHINDTHSYTIEPINLKVSTDYFTDGVKFLVGFDKFGEDDGSDALNITLSPEETVGYVAEPDLLKPAKSLSLEACIEPLGRRQTVRIGLPAGGRAIVGRAASNDLSIDDPSVSKYHASISVGPDGQILVADTGSTNGTFVSGQRIAYGQSTFVQRTDIVKFGSVEVKLKIIPSETGEMHSGSDTIIAGIDADEKYGEIDNSLPTGKTGKID